MNEPLFEPGLCVSCGKPKPPRKYKYCSPECRHERDLKRKQKQRDEEKLTPLDFASPEALRRYLRAVEAKEVLTGRVAHKTRSLAEAEAEAEALEEAMGPRKGPTQAVMREQGFMGQHMARSGTGPRTGE